MSNMRTSAVVTLSLAFIVGTARARVSLSARSTAVDDYALSLKEPQLPTRRLYLDHACDASMPCPSDGEFCYTDTGVCGTAQGSCQTKPMACAKVSDPVCGCDLNEYGNECIANLNGVSVMHQGSCSQVNVWNGDGYGAGGSGGGGYGDDTDVYVPQVTIDCTSLTEADVDMLEQQLIDLTAELAAAKETLVNTLEECISVENELATVRDDITNRQDPLIAELEADINDPAVLEKLKRITKLECALADARLKIQKLVEGQQKIREECEEQGERIDALDAQQNEMAVDTQAVRDAIEDLMEDTYGDITGSFNYTISQIDGTILEQGQYDEVVDYGPAIAPP